RFEKLFAQTSFITNQNVIGANEISSANPTQRYQDMVQYHIKSLYKNHGWSDSLAQSNNDLQTHIQRSVLQTTTDTELNLAEIEVNNIITIIDYKVTFYVFNNMFAKSRYLGAG